MKTSRLFTYMLLCLNIGSVFSQTDTLFNHLQKGMSYTVDYKGENLFLLYRDTLKRVSLKDGHTDHMLLEGLDSVSILMRSTCASVSIGILSYSIKPNIEKSSFLKVDYFKKQVNKEVLNLKSIHSGLFMPGFNFFKQSGDTLVLALLNQEYVFIKNNFIGRKVGVLYDECSGQRYQYESRKIDSLNYERSIIDNSGEEIFKIHTSSLSGLKVKIFSKNIVWSNLANGGICFQRIDEGTKTCMENYKFPVFQINKFFLFEKNGAILFRRAELVNPTE